MKVLQRILPVVVLTKADLCEDATALENKEVSSFINGITRDITAVKNAIQYDYNNGLAEGNVNKLKVIKRIMYGRCNFEMLRKKILRRENCLFN